MLLNVCKSKGAIFRCAESLTLENVNVGTEKNIGCGQNEMHHRRKEEHNNRSK